MSNSKYNDSAKKIFSIVRFWGLIYYIGSIPFRLTFLDEGNMFSATYIGTLIVDYVTDIFFIFDDLRLSKNSIDSLFQSLLIGAKENVAIFPHDVITKDGPKLPGDASDILFQRYESKAKKWGFDRRITYISALIDFMSLIPWEVLAYFWGMPNFYILRGLKLLRVQNYNIYWEEFRETLSALSTIKSPSILRFFYLALILAQLAHYGACLHYIISLITFRNGDANAWVLADGLVTRNSEGIIINLRSMGYRYLRAIYWSVQYLDTVGFGDSVSKNELETWFAIMFFIVSSLTLFYSNSNMMTALMSLDADKADTLVKKTRFAKYATYRNLPRRLSVKVDNYFEYHYKKLKGAKDQEIMLELPIDLAQQINQHSFRDLLLNIDLLSGLHRGLINSLSEKFEMHLFHPSDIILDIDESVHGIYILSRGEVLMISIHGFLQRIFHSRSWFGLRGLCQSYFSTHRYEARSYVEICFLRGTVFRSFAPQYISNENLSILNKNLINCFSYPQHSSAVVTSKYTLLSKFSNNSKKKKQKKYFSPTNNNGKIAYWGSVVSFLGALISSKKDDDKNSRKPYKFSSWSESVLHPTSILRRWWDTVVFLGMAFYVTAAISLVALCYRFKGVYAKMYPLLVVSYILDVFFTVHTIFSAYFFPYIDEEGITVIESTRIAKHFWQQNHPVKIFLALFPVDVVVGIGLGVKYVPFIRMLKLIHAQRLFHYLDLTLDFVGFLTGMPLSFEMRRFITLYFCLFESLHWAGNVWLFAAYFSVEEMGYPINWIMKDQQQGVIVRIDRDGEMYFVNYTRAIYWASIAMSSIGLQDIISANPVEVSVAVVTMFFGYFTFNALVGASANVISTFNRDQREFHAKMDRVQGLLKYMEVPTVIEQRVMRYYDYIFSRFGGIEEQEIFDSLPPTLRLEVISYVVGPLVRQVPFFASLSEPVERLLFSLFESRILLNNDALMIQGEIGKEMFVIERGKIEVTSADRKIIYATLGERQYIGESSLLERSPRTASVYAVGFVDTFCITHDKFVKIAEEYPDEFEAITDAIRETIAEKKRMNAERILQVQKDEDEYKRQLLEERRQRLIVLNKATKGLRSVKQRGHVILTKDVKAAAPQHRSIFSNVLMEFLAYINRLNEMLYGVSPQSSERLIWDMIIYMTLIYYMLAIPLRLALPVPSETYALDHFFDLLNMMDVYAHARVFSVYISGELTSDRHTLTNHYFHLGYGVIDTLAVIPFDLLAFTSLIYPTNPVEGEHHAIEISGLQMLRALLRIPKMIKVITLSRYSAQSDRCISYWKINYVFYQIASLTFTIITFGHWIACGWILVAEYQFDHRCRTTSDMYSIRDPVIDCHYIGTWIEQQWMMYKLPADGGSSWKKYLRAINYSIPLLCASTMGDVLGINEVESLYTFFVVVVALSVSGAIIGNIVNVVVDTSGGVDGETDTMEIAAEQLPGYAKKLLNQSETLVGDSREILSNDSEGIGLSETPNLQSKAKSFHQLLHYNDDNNKTKKNEKHILTELQQEETLVNMIRSATDFWQYLRTSDGSFARLQDNILNDIPVALRNQIDWEQRALPYLKPCPFFASIPDDILQGLSRRLQAVLFVEGDVILRPGEVAEAMYFVHEGCVQLQVPYSSVTEDKVKNQSMLLITKLCKGDFFGETALFGTMNHAWDAQIVATSPPGVTCYSLAKKDFVHELKVADEESTCTQLTKDFEEWFVKDRKKRDTVVSNYITQSRLATLSCGDEGDLDVAADQLDTEIDDDKTVKINPTSKWWRTIGHDMLVTSSGNRIHNEGSLYFYEHNHNSSGNDGNSHASSLANGLKSSSKRQFRYLQESSKSIRMQGDNFLLFFSRIIINCIINVATWIEMRNLIRGLILVYYLFTVPMYVAFFTERIITSLFVGWEICISLWWCGETLSPYYINAYTPLFSNIILKYFPRTEAELIMRKMDISKVSISRSKKIISFWAFVSDIVSAFPVEIFLLVTITSSFYTPSRNLIDYRLVLFFRIGHLLRPVSIYVDALTDVFAPLWYIAQNTSLVGRDVHKAAGVGKRAWILVLKGMLAFVLVSHWLSCGFFFIHRYVDYQEKRTYLTMDNRSIFNSTLKRHNVCAVSLLHCYARTLYFVLSTTTSTGLGDMQPYTDHEVMWEQVTMICGAYSVAIYVAFCGLYQSRLDVNSDYVLAEKLRALESFLAYKRLPCLLANNIRAQYKYNWNKYRNLTGHRQQQPWLLHLSKPLQDELVYAIHRPFLQRYLPWLQSHMSLVFQQRFAAALQTQISLSQAPVYKAGDPGQTLYFIMQGRVSVHVTEDKACLDAFGYRGRRFLLYKHHKIGHEQSVGQHFGEMCLLSHSGLRPDSVTAIEATELYVLQKRNLRKLLATVPESIRRTFLWYLFASSFVEHGSLPLGVVQEDKPSKKFDICEAPIETIYEVYSMTKMFTIACEVVEEVTKCLIVESIRTYKNHLDQGHETEHFFRLGEKSLTSAMNDDASSGLKSPSQPIRSSLERQFRAALLLSLNHHSTAMREFTGHCDSLSCFSEKRSSSNFIDCNIVKELFPPGKEEEYLAFLSTTIDSINPKITTSNIMDDFSSFLLSDDTDWHTLRAWIHRNSTSRRYSNSRKHSLRTMLERNQSLQEKQFDFSEEHLQVTQHPYHLHGNEGLLYDKKEEEETKAVDSLPHNLQLCRTRSGCCSDKIKEYDETAETVVTQSKDPTASYHEKSAKDPNLFVSPMIEMKDDAPLEDKNIKRSITESAMPMIRLPAEPAGLESYFISLHDTQVQHNASLDDLDDCDQPSPAPALVKDHSPVLRIIPRTKLRRFRINSKDSDQLNK